MGYPGACCVRWHVSGRVLGAESDTVWGGVMTEAEWIKKIKAAEAQSARVEEWETEEPPTQAAAPTGINIYNDHRTYIVQTAISAGIALPAPQIHIVDGSDNMEESARRIAANPNYARLPLTKEEKAALPWQCFGP